MNKPLGNNLASHTTKAILTALILFSLTTCKKFGTSQDLFFYSDIDSASAPMTLFVDDELKGVLPNLHVQVSVDNDTITREALHLSLKPGKYNLVAKDNQGNVRCEGWFKFSKNSVKTSATKGGQAFAGSNTTKVFELFFN
jgi:hypothetical protein